jgi:ElaB/YqjD/DUF883 family membrane-anchored ribosome-binding protein
MIDRIQGFEGAIGPTAENWQETALDLVATARERLARGTDTVRAYTVQQPARALGIALGIGVLLGWLIKRR